MNNSTFRKGTLFFSIVLISNYLQAQVEDLSFTISPTLEYVSWSDDAGLSNDVLFGGTVGFGFGEFLELRGVFQTSRNLSTDFSSYGLSNFSNETFESQGVNLDRYGGELKINFSNTNFSPYLTLGTGIQSLKPDNSQSFEQIYASAGLGLRFALTNRLNLLIEGRAVGFNINAPNNLLSPSNQSEYDVNTADFSRDGTLNLSAMAGLQVYLGGRRPGQLSSLDRAYLNNYKGGFDGWTWVLEPSLAYINFDSNSLYRDTWMAGGYAGVDFTEYVGVRGFYFQGTDEALGVDNFDRLNMYGLEFRAKLNDGRGVNPYLILGGGYLNVQSGYETVFGGSGAQSTGFANAGLGLDVPLGQNILLTGGARAMATSSRDIEDITGPDVLQTHVMFNVGVKVQLGRKLRPENNDFILKEQAEFNAKTSPASSAEYARLQELRRDYEKDLKALDAEYNKAYQTNDTKKAVAILEQKKQINSSLREIEKLENLYGTDTSKGSGEYLKMTPEEFESLIDRILQGIDEKYKASTQNTQKASDEEALMLNLFQRIEALEQDNSKKGATKTNKTSGSTTSAEEPSTKKVDQKKQEDILKTLEKNAEQQDQLLKNLENKAKEQDNIQEEINSKSEEQKRLEKELRQKMKEQEKLQKALDKKAKEQEKTKSKNEQDLKEAKAQIQRLERELEAKEKEEKAARAQQRDTIN